jgi:hypothetical protein
MCVPCVQLEKTLIGGSGVFGGPNTCFVDDCFDALRHATIVELLASLLLFICRAIEGARSLTWIRKESYHKRLVDPDHILPQVGKATASRQGHAPSRR